MIASKGQLVKLIGQTETAKVISIIATTGYEDLPEGERGIQLDKELDGSRWYMETDIERAD